MRYLLAVMMMFLFCGASYEKVSDTVVTKTVVSENIQETTLTLSALKSQKASLEASKASTIASIDKQIADIDKDIAELVKLEIIEIDGSGNIVK